MWLDINCHICGDLEILGQGEISLWILQSTRGVWEVLSKFWERPLYSMDPHQTCLKQTPCNQSRHLKYLSRQIITFQFMVALVTKQEVGWGSLNVFNYLLFKAQWSQYHPVCKCGWSQVHMFWEDILQYNNAEYTTDPF